MINLLLFLVFIACMGLTGAWVAENPGSVTLFWFDYRVDTSVAFIVLTTMAAACALAFAILLLRRIILGPAAFFQHRSLRHHKRALSELAYSVAALAASDIKSAEAHTKKVEKLIGRSPITLLLSAQIAKTRGDDDATRNLLENLLEHKETQYLAARSLSDVANKQENLPRALEMATRAQHINPKNISAALAVVSLKLRMGEWQAAMSALKKTKLPRSEQQRLQALIQLEHGESLLDQGRDEAALTLARSVAPILSDFPPACAFAARAENHYLRKAVRTLSRAWKKSPHPLLKTTLEDILTAESPARREKILRHFATRAETGRWICSNCHHTHEKWQLHCTDCSSFDTVVWE